MQSFVSTKTEVRFKQNGSVPLLEINKYKIMQILTSGMLLKATEELRGRLAKLKTMYGSGVKALDDITGELNENSHSTFGRLNSEVAKHSTALEDVSVQFIWLDGRNVTSF